MEAWGLRPTTVLPRLSMDVCIAYRHRLLLGSLHHMVIFRYQIGETLGSFINIASLLVPDSKNQNDSKDLTYF